MKSFLMRRSKFVELIQGEALAPRILIILMEIQKGKSKRILRRSQVQENLPMKMKIMGIPKIKKRMYLSDAETEDNNNEENDVEMSQPNEESQEEENNE